MSSEFSIQRRPRLFALLGVLFCLATSFTTAAAEENIDAAPVIVSEANSTRALTGATKRGSESEWRVFSPGGKTRVTVFVTGINLLPGEDATAFRADATDGRYARFPLEVISLVPTQERPWVYALTFRLHAGMGDVGEVLLRVTWRGMSSNRVRLAIGHEGDGLKDDDGAIPTPIPDKPLVSELSNRAGLPYAGDRVRFMQQATFGANPALENLLRRTSYSTWIAQQMQAKSDGNETVRYSTFPMPNPDLMPDNISAADCPPVPCQREKYSMYLLQNWFYREALYGEDRQLRRRVSWALHQIFVVSGRETVQSGRMAPYIKILDQNAFGNFRDLLKEMTLNPAMGNYLDMAISTRQNPNENYAREIMQLFSIGLDMLNQDGTPKTDSQGNRIPSYTQDTVNNFTKVFTGWGFCNNPTLPACGGFVTGTRNFKDPMLLNPANHDVTEKNLLNYPGAIPTLAAGQTAEQDLDMALDNIFNHPNVAPFISKLLIQQLVTSNPTPAYVKRVADVFSDVQNGGADRGNLAKVVRAILLDPEARGNLKTDPDYGHLKEPVIYVTNFLRALSPTSNTGAPGTCGGLSDGVINGVTLNLDQDVFNPPSVFNYYPLDYSIPNTNLAAPEFAIMTTGTALKRPNLIHQMIGPGNATPANAPPAVGIVVNNGQGITCGTRVVLTRYQNLATADPTGVSLVDALNREFMNGSMSQAVRTQILNAIQPIASTNSLKRTQTALYLILTSSQYQVQR